MKTMHRCSCTSGFLTFLAVILFSGLIRSQPVILAKPLSPRIANYRIDISLDTGERTLAGKEVLTWKNTSPDTVGELRLHLYLNAFRNNRSTFMKESRGSLRGYEMEEEGWGYIDVERIALPSGADVTEEMEFVSPDDGNEDDRTVFRLPLPASIQPGDSAFCLHLPGIVGGLGGCYRSID